MNVSNENPTKNLTIYRCLLLLLFISFQEEEDSQVTTKKKQKNVKKKKKKIDEGALFSSWLLYCI